MLNPIKQIKKVKNNYDQKIRLQTIEHLSANGLLNPTKVVA
jgi:hypothetical protein